MNRWKLFAVGLLSLASAACGGQTACKDCPPVAGTYSEESSGSGVVCGGGRSLNFLGGALGDFAMEQKDSELILKGWFDIKGTLNADLSATFGPFPAIALPTMLGGTDSPGKMTIEGRFTQVSPPIFEGKYVFTAFIDQCKLEGPTKWTFAPQ